MDGPAWYAPVLLFREANRVRGMTTAIYQLAQQAKLDEATVDAFIASHSFPIVEDSCVTFWQAANTSSGTSGLKATACR